MSNIYYNMVIKLVYDDHEFSAIYKHKTMEKCIDILNKDYLNNSSIIFVKIKREVEWEE